MAARRAGGVRQQLVAQRLAAQWGHLDDWIATLTPQEAARTTVRGISVADLAARAAGRRTLLDALPRPEDLLLAEVGLLSDCVALGDALPDRPGPAQTDGLAAAVRTSLGRLAALFPGHLVEVRVPPWAAVQIGVPGHEGSHSRGTPPNVVETDARTWLALASGDLAWPDAVRQARVSASGVRAQLDHVLPLG